MHDRPGLPPDDRKRGTVKRKFDLDGGNDPKRIKQEFNDVLVNQRRIGFPSLARRSAEEVLADVVTKVTQGDRQIAGHLLREFSLDHLSSIGRCAETATNMLLDAIFKVKHDQVANVLLKYLKYVLSCADKQLAKDTMTKFFSEGLNLIERPGLDVRILSLITDCYERRALEGVTIPESVLVCAQRSLRHTSNSQSRMSAIQFYVAKDFNAFPRRQHKDFQELEKTLMEMTTDRDARVRLAAADGLLKLSALPQRRYQLSLKAYYVAKTLAHDTDSQVRKIVLRIILNIAKHRGKQLIKISPSDKRTLMIYDDAFSAICHAINDMEVDVRAEAAVLLGEFKRVSDDFLEQTLDKKLMRTMRTTGAIKHEKTSMFSIAKGQKWVKPQQRWKSWKEPKQQAQASSEWASGKDLNAPTPAGPGGAVKEEEESIIPQGACGAFVSALEDEFMSVRKGAVYSLGKLAAHRPFFASTALEHLTDMFNDEIAEVRLDAIHALTPLVVHGQLLKEQLAVMLKCLDDAMYESRQALRDLLAKGEFADADCMRMTTNALLNCLARFPADKDMIFQCFSKLGAKHGVFVHTMVDSLLDLHPVFEPQEQLVDNPVYLSKLVLILSAAAHYEPIISLLPAFVLRHYRFMRASAPLLVSPIKLLDERFSLNSNVLTQTDDGKVNAEILTQTYGKLIDSVGLSTLQQRNTTRAFISSDAEAICSFNTYLAGAAQFLNVLTELASTTDTLEETILRGGDLSRVQDLLHEELTTVMSALRLFSSLDDAVQSFLYALATHLKLLSCLVKLLVSPEVYASVVHEIREIVRESKSVLEETKVTPLLSHSTAITEVLEVIDRMVIDEKKFLSTGRLADILSRTTPPLPKGISNIEKIKVKWAQISEPERQTALERPIKFIAGYPTVVNMTTSLHHFQQADLADVRIQIDYPDQTRAFFKPRPADFCHLQEGVYSLTTKVIVQSSAPWSDSALLKLTVVMLSGMRSSRSSCAVAIPESPATRRPSTILVKCRPVQRM